MRSCGAVIVRDTHEGGVQQCRGAFFAHWNVLHSSYGDFAPTAFDAIWTNDPMSARIYSSERAAHRACTKIRLNTFDDCAVVPLKELCTTRR